MIIYFAGIPANSRESTLWTMGVKRRLLTYGYVERIYYVIKKWGSRYMPESNDAPR